MFELTDGPDKLPARQKGRRVGNPPVILLDVQSNNEEMTT
jgi:hypothetical protein